MPRKPKKEGFAKFRVAEEKKNAWVEHAGGQGKFSAWAIRALDAVMHYEQSRGPLAADVPGDDLRAASGPSREAIEEDTLRDLLAMLAEWRAARRRGDREK